MSYFSLKFRPMFAMPLLTGVKTCTSRTKKMGNPGDRFVAFGAEFELLSVEEKRLDEVRLLWKEEGCQSEEHFKEVWKSIHPKVGYDDYQIVKLHTFKLIGLEA
jgi:hypothetical protein